MAAVACAKCEEVREIAVVYVTTGKPTVDVLSGTVTCEHCGSQTVFKLKQNSIRYYPGGIESGLTSQAAANAKEMVEEAHRCFYGGSYRGVVAFCRSAVEEALDDKNVTGSDLNQKTERARKATPPILGDEEVSMSHGARLTGRNAIHRMAEVSERQAMLALTAASELVNHVAQQPAIP